ncbi:MAG: type III polyketide synthase [Spirochaetaceae bacterium]|nr:MAG: type III polyketide synthase [Spirochaetaceae bacterium]
MKSRNSAEGTIWLQGIATATPPQGYSQDFALRFMKELPLYGEKERKFLDRLYPSTGIDRRHTAVPDYGRDRKDYDFFSRDPSMLPEPSPAQRNDLYITAAAALAEEAARNLLRELNGDLSGVTHLVTVSCTGFSAPGFDYHLVQTLGLSPTVFRTHIGFMGCYAAFPALRLAHTICTAEPDAQVLIVDVELCSLHFQFKPDLETIVANAIFADGAAAALVSRNQPVHPPSARYAIRSFNSRIIADSEKEMSWRLGEVAFDMRLSAYVPRLIERDIGEIVRTTMAEVSMQREDVRLWAIHPGGRAILDRVRETLELTEEDLADSTAVLREFGNMSSATIFFVLKRMLSGPRSGPVFAAAFGPGLTVESAFLEHRMAEAGA